MEWNSIHKESFRSFFFFTLIALYIFPVNGYPYIQQEYTAIYRTELLFSPVSALNSSGYYFITCIPDILPDCEADQILFNSALLLFNQKIAIHYCQQNLTCKLNSVIRHIPAINYADGDDENDSEDPASNS